MCVCVCIVKFSQKEEDEEEEKGQPIQIHSVIYVNESRQILLIIVLQK